MSLASQVSALAGAIRDKFNSVAPKLLPPGGATGQFLVKTSNDDFTTEWVSSTSNQDWTILATQWQTAPILVGTTSEGSVFSYTDGGVTRFRLVPSPYNALQDAFYSNFSGGILSGLLVLRG